MDPGLKQLIGLVSLSMALGMLIMLFLTSRLLGVFIIAFTVVYGKKALYPIYTFILITGIFNGFASWWIPYIYIWAVLWGIVMLLPRRMPKWLAVPLYMIVCGLHGLAYGTLYAPVQAIAYGLDWKAMLTWIASGFPWDVAHAIGNVVSGILIVPISSVLLRLERKYSSR